MKVSIVDDVVNIEYKKQNNLEDVEINVQLMSENDKAIKKDCVDICLKEATKRDSASLVNTDFAAKKFSFNTNSFR